MCIVHCVQCAMFIVCSSLYLRGGVGCSDQSSGNRFLASNGRSPATTRGDHDYDDDDGDDNNFHEDDDDDDDQLWRKVEKRRRRRHDASSPDKIRPLMEVLGSARRLGCPSVKAKYLTFSSFFGNTPLLANKRYS